MQCQVPPAPQVGEERHCTANTEMGAERRHREHEAILSCQLKTSKAGASAMPSGSFHHP